MDQELFRTAEALTLEGWGREVTYSRKVFIPLTHLCRDVCHYCTFAKAPRSIVSPFLTIDECVEIARQGHAAGCKEALFTLGDQPELRYPVAQRWLQERGYGSTLDYLAAAAETVFEQTGLLPHLNPGVMGEADIARLRTVSVSMGLMLETSSDRLSQKGGPHFGSPDKLPARRLDTLRAAGKLRVPVTTGLLVGIGETRDERLQSLRDLRDLHEQYGHIQELIIQNFRAKPGTRMAGADEPSLAEHVWTIAQARLMFGPAMSIQAPPNLRAGELQALIRAGVNDWGGVSPVTPDHVNPEAPWPHLDSLAQATRAADRDLVERLAIGPRFVGEGSRWLDKRMVRPVLQAADSAGLARLDQWKAGTGDTPPILPAFQAAMGVSRSVARLLDRCVQGERLTEAEVTALFSVRDNDLAAVIRAADDLRRSTVGDAITYVTNRNINYTNICLYHCTFCAFSKGGGARDARGPAYRLDLDEIARRAREAQDRRATEVCLQGGIHPHYTGATYLEIVRVVKAAAPGIHVHAFSPLEVTHGARTLGLSLFDYLTELKAVGLSSLPGTAAEILDEEVRSIICPDKVGVAEWLEVMEVAHSVGLRSTATIMYGHIEHPRHWARHLLLLRDLQSRTGGFTEFVPLPFVHMEAPMWRKGLARPGPTYREAVLMHAVARLVLHPHFVNIQTSWVKMGPEGAAHCLQAGANDLGGVLMDESITRAAGGKHGQAMDADAMALLADAIGRPLCRRTTLYGAAPVPAVPAPEAIMAI